MSSVLLSPAAAYVLANPDRSNGTEALKIAVSWLLGKGALRIEQTEKKRLLGTSKSTTVARGEPRPVPPHAEELVNLAPAAGVGLTDFVTRAKGRFGPSMAKFKGAIMSELIAAGLIDEVRKKSLLVFTTTSHRPTAAGAAQQAEIGRILSALRSVPPLLKTDPAKAAAVTAAAGGLVFLLPELRPHLSALSAAIQSAAALDIAGDFGAIDLTSFGDFDTGAFDAFDSSFDSAVGDSGSANDSGGGGGD